jgi:glutaredoxin
MPRMRSIMLLAVLLALGIPAAAQVYKWTDSTGKVHYGDKPPDDVKTSQVKVDAVTSYEGPPQVDSWASIIRGSAASRPPDAKTLTMYSTTWCGYCKRARAYLAANAIPYKDIDIEATPENRAQFKAYGGKGVPMFILGEQRLRGFNEAKLGEFLKTSR